MQTEQALSPIRATRAGNVQRIRALGLGLISGAADDDPAAIGTYASAGAKLGPGFLWIAPAVLPMMYAVVYVSAKLGQVSGLGLFDLIRKYYPRWLLAAVLGAVVIGNTIEAAADLGGMAAAMNLLVPLPIPLLAVGIGALVLALQIFASYTTIRNVFRWATLALLAYFGAAILAKPDLGEVVKGTLFPRIEFTSEFFTLVVAVLGTSLSAYLFTWQSNAEVEEGIAQGRTTVEERRGAPRRGMRRTRRDVVFGMVAANLVMYFVMLATASTLHKTGQHEIDSAAQAAAALAGRDYVIPDDIKTLAQPVWRHRLLLRPESSLRGRNASAVIETVLAETTLDLGEAS